MKSQTKLKYLFSNQVKHLKILSEIFLGTRLVQEALVHDFLGALFYHFLYGCLVLILTHFLFILPWKNDLIDEGLLQKSEPLKLNVDQNLRKSISWKLVKLTQNPLNQVDLWQNILLVNNASLCHFLLTLVRIKLNRNQLGGVRWVCMVTITLYLDGADRDHIKV